MTAKPTLAMKVRVKRQEKGYSQSELAKKSGLTQATISRLESGKVSQPRSDRIKKLADALEVTADFLVGKKDKLDFDDALRSDKMTQWLFGMYETLNREQRHYVLRFVHFLTGETKPLDKEDRAAGNVPRLHAPSGMNRVRGYIERIPPSELSQEQWTAREAGWVIKLIDEPQPESEGEQL